MELQCPMPKFDFDTITMGHGSGGLLTHRLLKSGVFDILKNEWLDQQHDGALLNVNGKIAFSSDSYVVSPIFFPGGNIGDLAINGTVNDLAMCGANAEYLSLSFIIEEGLMMEELWQILLTIKKAADKAGVIVVTGDTKVVEKGKGDKIFINTSGIGHLHPNAIIHHNRIKEGDVVIVSGNIASHGIAIMSVREGLEFETTIETDSTPLNKIIVALLDEFGANIKFLRDATRGGVASVMNEVTEITSLGIYVEEKTIPLEEQVEGACEMLGLDPLYVANEGVFLAIVDSNIAHDMLETLKNFKECKHAAIIGHVNSENKGKVIMKSKVGGTRMVNFLPGEQLPRIC
ncbi:MAG: hydrogenase expression/formation protein HypE [Saprospiraceae bacterium]|nr:hydrogenase expression/formation protein HypE [Saprospiraceae bacterium]